MTIDTLEQWAELRTKLLAGKYRIWQMQYGTDAPEGFHIWFDATGQPEIEVVTFNETVHDVMIHYKPGK